MESERRLNRLRRQGRHILSSSFELDAEQAREKLARYQLVDPHRYVLQFVQAAVLLGATRIEISIDADELELTYDGSALDRAQLADVYLRAFARADSDAERAIRHIAIGLIASTAIVPERVEVDFHGDESVRFELVGDDERVVDIAATEGVQRFYVRESFRAGHLVEFFRRFGGRYAEEAALADAVYAPCMIRVNGQRMWHQPPQPMNRTELETPFERGWLTVADASKYGDHVAFTQNGVVVERARLDVGNVDVGGVVDTRRLTTNLSHSAFVRNEPWHELHDEVLLPTALEMFADRLERLLTAANRLDVSEVIAAALRARARLRAKHRPLPSALDQTVMRLADVPVWRHVRPSDDAQRYVSTRDLLAAIGDGPVPFATKEHIGLTVRNDDGAVMGCVLLVARRSRSALDPTLLAEATGRGLVDLTSNLQDEHRKRVVEGRSGIDIFARAGLTSGWPPTLDSRHRARGEVIRDGIHIHVGVELPIVVREARIVVVTSRDSVVRIAWRVPTLDFVTVAIVDTSSSGVSADALVRRHVTDIAEAVACMVATDARALPSTQLKSLLLPLLRGQLAGRIASEVGVAPAPHGPTTAGFVAGASSPGHTSAALGVAPHAKIFETLRGSALSIRALAQRASIDYIDARRKTKALQLRHDLELAEHDTPVIWLSSIDRELLTLLFGPDALRDVSEPIRIAATRAKRLDAGMEEDPVLHGIFDHHRLLRGPDLEGQLGLSELVAGDGSIDLVILHDRKRLTRRTLPHRFARVRAIVESSKLRPTPDMSDVEEDDAFDELVGHVTDLARDLTEHALSEHVGAPPGHWASLYLWTAVLDAVQSGTADHRLQWPLFWRADETTASYLELDREAGETLRFIRGRRGGAENKGDRLALQLPLASQSHIACLRELFPDRALVDQTPHRNDEITATEGASRAAAPPAHQQLVMLLSEAGHAVRHVEFDGEGPPRIRGDVVILPEVGDLADAYRERPDELRRVALIAVALLHRRPIAIQTLSRLIRDRLG